MTKGRLEEIEKNLDPLGYGMGGHLISVNDIYWLVGYAKEQAERVEELEKVEYALQETYRQEREYNKKLEQQNQRYKQALERILDFYPGVPNADFIPVEMLFEIKGIAFRGLEREG